MKHTSPPRSARLSLAALSLAALTMLQACGGGQGQEGASTGAAINPRAVGIAATEADGKAVVVRARATLAGGVGAQMEVRVDGQLVGSQMVSNTGAVQDYRFPVPAVLAAGAKVDVVFTNDAVMIVNGLKEDRNLIVESVEINETSQEPASATIDVGSGTAAFDGINTLPGQMVLPWNAALRFTAKASPGGASAGKVTVRASATLVGGVGALMVVRVDGQILGSVYVNNVGTAQDYNFNTPTAIPPGARIDVVFLNDALIYNAAGIKEDRNLIVDSVTVDGGTPMKPTDPGVVIDQGSGAAAFDGVSTVPGQRGVWWNGALRFTTTRSQLIGGRVIDGYLIGAQVFWDCNDNFKIDDGSEPWVTSMEGGRYEIAKSPSDSCLLRAIIPPTALDESTGKLVGRPFRLSSIAGRPSVISPLTSMITDGRYSQEEVKLLTGFSADPGADYIAAGLAGVRNANIAGVVAIGLPSISRAMIDGNADGRAIAFQNLLKLYPADAFNVQSASPNSEVFSKLLEDRLPNVSGVDFITPGYGHNFVLQDVDRSGLCRDSVKNTDLPIDICEARKTFIRSAIGLAVRYHAIEGMRINWGKIPRDQRASLGASSIIPSNDAVEQRRIEMNEKIKTLDDLFTIAKNEFSDQNLLILLNSSLEIAIRVVDLTESAFKSINPVAKLTLGKYKALKGPEKLSKTIKDLRKITKKGGLVSKLASDPKCILALSYSALDAFADPPEGAREISLDSLQAVLKIGECLMEVVGSEKFKNILALSAGVLKTSDVGIDFFTEPQDRLQFYEELIGLFDVMSTVADIAQADPLSVLIQITSLVVDRSYQAESGNVAGEKAKMVMLDVLEQTQKKISEVSVDYGSIFFAARVDPYITLDVYRGYIGGVDEDSTTAAASARVSLAAVGQAGLASSNDGSTYKFAPVSDREFAGGVFLYEWDFGDGSERVVANSPAEVRHKFIKSGSYVVTLKSLSRGVPTITGEVGEEYQGEVQNTFHVSIAGVPTAGIVASPSSAASGNVLMAGQTVHFGLTNGPSGTASVGWTFDGAQIATAIYHAFADGIDYLVTMTADGLKVVTAYFVGEDGEALGSVSSTFTVHAPPTPKVNAVTPVSATTTIGVVQTFTVTGTNLVDGMSFRLADCTNVTEILVGASSTQRQFSCVFPARTSPGEKEGTISAAGSNGQPFGEAYKAFTVTLKPFSVPSTAVINPGNGHAYEVIDCGTWTQCRDAARATGGELAAIGSRDEDEWITQTMIPKAKHLLGFWIGLSDSGHEGVWEWTNGEPYSYSNWTIQNPSNSNAGEHYVHKFKDPIWFGQWNDWPNDAGPTMVQALVEYSATAVSARSKLPHTGITTEQCYKAGSNALLSCASPEAIALSGPGKQDGMYANVNPMSYSAVPNPAGGSFDKTQCVQDNVTGLVWEGKEASGTRGVGNNYTNLANGAANDTSGYVAAVNALALCGHSDWRLPTPDELQTLVSYARANPAVDTTWFASTAINHYWTATPYAADPSYAWSVLFSHGGVGNYGRSYPGAVRLVRASQ